MNWRPDFQPENLCFVTTTVVSHLHLFERDVMKRLILDAMDNFRLHGRWKIFCFVIMPNHIHIIVQFIKEDPMADVLRDFKKLTSDRVLRFLKAENNQQTLATLATKVPHPEKQSYKVWEDGYNAKDVFSPDFLRQKMEYIHNNPCQPHWNLTDAPENYLWSSARFYHSEFPCIIPIDDAKPLLLG